MKKSPPKLPVVWVERRRFTEIRYERFVAKKAALRDSPLGPSTYLTDLDAEHRELGIPMKELVLCDRCNENIEEAYFLMFEGSLCWHEKCTPEAERPGGGKVFEFRKRPT